MDQDGANARAFRQIANIGAVLIHQRQPLDAAFLGPAFIDEHHAAVEIAFFSGQALVDLVVNDVPDLTPRFMRGDIFLVVDVLTDRAFPESRLRLYIPT